MASAPTIFVQIASYRDPECQWTVWDLFSKADRPDLITIGICWQYDPYRDMDCFTAPSPRPAQTKIVTTLPWKSEGVCWARAQAQTLFGDQDYVLMIDSHMRFIKGWDTALIAELARCGSEKPFLSNYPPGYKPPDFLEPDPRFIVLRAKPFNDQGDIRFDGESLMRPPEKPLRGAFLAAGFLFAPGKFVREVPYDPFMYFDHEEVTLAARAYTHGWDVYSPSKTFVYHYYPEPEKGEKKALHWTDLKDWEKFLTRSRARYRYLLAGEIPAQHSDIAEIERYGLGTSRTLAEYENFCGLDFRAKTASPKALESGFIADIERYRQAEPVVLPAAGDHLPPLFLSDARGGRHDVVALAEGRPVILCVLPGRFDDYVREFMVLHRAQGEQFEALGVGLIFVAPVSFSALNGFRKKYDIPQKIFADETLGLCRAFGVAGSASDSPLSIGVDAQGTITAIYTNRNAVNHMNDILREAQTLAMPDARKTVQSS
jgi:peroxiredoxin